MWRPAANGENAHNNFVQVLAESGALGLASFVWLLVASVGATSRWRADAASDVIRPGIVGGLAAFLLTSLAGHPLLVEAVRLCFFFWLGCVAAGTSVEPSPGRGRWPTRVIGASALIVAILVAPRIVTARRDANAVGATAGVGRLAGKVDGVPYQPAARDSAWVIAPETTTVDWTLRAEFGSPRPCRVEIEVDRRPATVIDLDDVVWRPLRLELPPPAQPRPSRRLDVRIQTDGCLLLAGPMNLR